MNVYVAGSSLDRVRYRTAVRLLEAAGHEITFDWDENWGDDNAAQMCLDGIDDCEALVFLAPTDGFPSRGAWVELGYAIAGAALTEIAIIGIGDVDNWGAYADRFVSVDEWIASAARLASAAPSLTFALPGDVAS